LNTRIIAGTNADLEERIAEGRFRRDLYYRLNVINIQLPPLRKRGQDILLLARHFLARYRTEYASTAQRFSPEAEALLMSHNWPGNVRELQHVIEQILRLAKGNKTRASQILGISRPRLSRKLEEYQIEA